MQVNVTGQWDPSLVQIDGLAINSILLPTGKILWFAYPQKPNFVPGYPGSPANEAAVHAATNWAEAYVFDPATNTSVRRDPPNDPRTNLPYNLWCAGQTMLRDGRVLVAGGNLEYYSQGDPKYKGHYVVLTFNPFNETWIVQPRMRHGRWYPTLTELGDGRVVITAGLDEEPLNVGNNNNLDVEVFTPSTNLDGVGSIELLREDQGFGLYPHVFLNTQGQLVVVGPDEEDSRLINPVTGAVTPTQTLPSYGAQGGRREWGSAVMLPSGPDGPSQILMVGGSDAEDDHYDNPDQTNSTLLVNMAERGDHRRAAQHPQAQPREHDHPPGRHAVHERRRRRERGRRPIRRARLQRRAPLPGGLELGRDGARPGGAHLPLHVAAAPGRPGRRRWATTAPSTPRTARCGRSSTTTRRTSTRARGPRSPRPRAAPPTACPWGSGPPTRSPRR